MVPPVGGWDKSLTDGWFFGLNNAAWGSHLYYSAVARYTRESSKQSNRPMTLTKVIFCFCFVLVGQWMLDA